MSGPPGAELGRRRLRWVRPKRHRASNSQQLRDTTAALQDRLSEMNHRIKNQLQILASYARAVAARPDTTPAEVAQEVSTHLGAIAALHDCLHRAAGEEISALELLTRACSAMERAGISIDIRCDPELKLGPRQLAPVAMIASEAVCNSIKHAFLDERHGEVRVSLTHGARQYVLEIEDNGVGYHPPLGHAQDGGLALIGSLARQLGGSATVAAGQPEGTRVTISFPAPAAAI